MPVLALYDDMFTSQAKDKWELQQLSLVFNLSADVFNLTEGMYTLYIFLMEIYAAQRRLESDVTVM